MRTPPPPGTMGYLPRSAYLSLLNGFCFMAVLVVIVLRQLPQIFFELSLNTYGLFTVCTCT